METAELESHVFFRSSSFQPPLTSRISYCQLITGLFEGLEMWLKVQTKRLSIQVVDRHQAFSNAVVAGSPGNSQITTESLHKQ